MSPSPFPSYLDHICGWYQYKILKCHFHRDLRPKYMTPLEVEEVMRRLWKNESALLRLIYAAELGKVVGAAGGTALLSVAKDAKASQSKRPVVSDEGFRMFFVRVLPVAPNKFRPPSKVGEQM